MISSFLHNLNMFIYHITNKSRKNKALLWDISSTLKGLSDTTSQRHHCALKPIISSGLRGATTVVCGHPSSQRSSAMTALNPAMSTAQMRCVFPYCPPNSQSCAQSVPQRTSDDLYCTIYHSDTFDFSSVSLLTAHQSL